MEILRLTGDHKERVLRMLSEAYANHGAGVIDIEALTIIIDGDGVKFKLNDGAWSEPIGGLHSGMRVRHRKTGHVGTAKYLDEDNYWMVEWDHYDAATGAKARYVVTRIDVDLL